LCARGASCQLRRDPCSRATRHSSRTIAFAFPPRRSGRAVRRHSDRRCPSPRVPSETSAPEWPNGLLRRQLGDSARRDAALLSATHEARVPVANVCLNPTRAAPRQCCGETRLPRVAGKAPAPTRCSRRAGSREAVRGRGTASGSTCSTKCRLFRGLALVAVPEGAGYGAGELGGRWGCVGVVPCSAQHELVVLGWAQLRMGHRDAGGVHGALEVVGPRV
jgi:hypothetical protein